MSRRLGRHVRQQFVGYMALFVALGGVSYAAITLPANSVRTKQIKNGQVKNADLANSAVTSAKVKDGSLLSMDFKPGQLVAGAPGAAGPPGPKGNPGTNGTNGTNGADGPRGPSDAYYKYDDDFVANKSTTLILPAGKFTIAAKVSAFNGTGTPNSSASCTLATGDPVPEHGDFTFLSVGAGAEAPATLETVADYPSGGTITLSCGSATTFGRMRIVATQVAALH